MKVKIELNPSSSTKKVECSEKWKEHLLKFGLEIKPHSSENIYGKTFRTMFCYDDPPASILIAAKDVRKLKINSYDIKMFPEQSQDNYSEFFYNKELREGKLSINGTINMLPPVKLMDKNNIPIGYFDPVGVDFYLHDITHDKPSDITIKMVEELIITVFKEYNITYPSSSEENYNPYSEIRRTVMYGMDPEFLIFDYFERKYINASYILDGSTGSSIGVDGCSFVGELRPEAGRTPEILVDNLRGLFKRLKKMLSGRYEMICGGNCHEGSHPTGGHIHISGIIPSDELICLFDYLIGIPLKNMRGGKRPEDSGYGRDSNIREQHYKDGTIGFEYRTPPSFITFPSITLGIFKLLQIIIEEGFLGKDLLEFFSRNEIIALGRDNYEKAILKRMYAFIQYGDLTCNPIPNWLEKEHLLTSKLMLIDQTGYFSQRELDSIRNEVVRENKTTFYSVRRQTITIEENFGKKEDLKLNIIKRLEY